MAKNSVPDWDIVANDNTDVGGISIDEGMPPSGVNNAMRETMAQVRVQTASLDNVYDVAVRGADGGDDDTAAIQAVIDAAKGTSESVGKPLAKVFIPRGTWNVSGLTLNRSVVIEGEEGAVLQHITGSADPMFLVSVAHDGSDYYAAGGLAPSVYIRNLVLRGAGKTDVGDAAAIEVDDAASNAITTRLLVENVQVTNFPRGIVGVSWTGYGKLLNCAIYNNGQTALDLNTCFDWHFLDCEFAVNGEHGILLSGCGEMQFHHCNTYSNQGKGLYCFNSTVYYQGMLDRNYQGGLFYANTGSYSAVIESTTFYQNSLGTADTYPDVKGNSGSNSLLRLIGCRFATAGGGGDNSHLNVDFDSGSFTIEHSACIFQEGSSASAHVTNVGSRFIQQTGATVRYATGQAIEALDPIRDGAAGAARGFQVRSSLLQRWQWGASATAESGSNVGSDWFLNAYNDAGSYLSTPLLIERSTGRMLVAAPIGLADGVTAPSTVSGRAFIYVDSADGDLKVKFGDGTVKTIVTDT